MEAKFTIGEARENKIYFGYHVKYVVRILLDGMLYAEVFGSTPELAEQRAREIANVELMKEAASNVYAFSQVALSHIKTWSTSKNENPELEKGLSEWLPKLYNALTQKQL